jgi:hypothetical protein
MSDIDSDSDSEELTIAIKNCLTCFGEKQPGLRRVESDISSLSNDSDSPLSLTSEKYSPRSEDEGSGRSGISGRSGRLSHNSKISLESLKSTASSSVNTLTPLKSQCLFMIETMIKVFPEERGFYVNDDYNSDMDDDDIAYIEFFVFNNSIKEKEGDLCLNFYFFPDENEEIMIERALTSKCGDVTGTEILNRMGMMFLILKKEYSDVTMKIRLDESELKFLKISRSLSWLYLFKSGMSWYNSKGYYEGYYDKNKELMDEFISKSISEVYDGDEILTSISIEGSQTIQVLFLDVSEKIKTNKEIDCCNYAHLLNNTIDKFIEFLVEKGQHIKNGFLSTKFYELWYEPTEEITTYLDSMIKELPSKGGKKSRKRRGNKGKNTRKKNKKNKMYKK